MTEEEAAYEASMNALGMTTEAQTEADAAAYANSVPGYTSTGPGESAVSEYGNIGYNSLGSALTSTGSLGNFNAALNANSVPGAIGQVALGAGKLVLGSIFSPVSALLGLGSTLNAMGSYTDPENTSDVTIENGLLSGTTTTPGNHEVGTFSNTFSQRGAKSNANFLQDMAINYPDQLVGLLGQSEGLYAGGIDSKTANEAIVDDAWKGHRWNTPTVTEGDQIDNPGLSAAESQVADQNQRDDEGSFDTGGEGGCFLTTAACEVLDKPDDCIELQTFRRVRDELLDHPIAKWLIRKYYREAPMKAELLRNHPNREEISATMFNKYIPRVMVALEKGQTWKAILLYWSMSNYVKKGVL